MKKKNTETAGEWVFPVLPASGGMLQDPHDFSAEALRRDKELDENPEAGLTLEQFRAFFES